jgi:uncharacterized protein (DUF983 family)
MTNCGDNVTCPGGNCPGCKNGKTWCQDPRCQPNCQGCELMSDHDFIVNIMMTIIILSLIAILFVVWFLYGPGLFEEHDDHERANVLTCVR